MYILLFLQYKCVFLEVVCDFDGYGFIGLVNMIGGLVYKTIHNFLVILVVLL